MSLDVLYEDNHLLVVNKPAGIATMGDPGRPTLHELAAAYLKEKYQKPHGVYVGIVSRLDAMTSGVIVLARTSKAAARLNEQFAGKSKSGNHCLRKSYLAIVRPEPNRAAVLPEDGHMEDWIYKDDAAHRMRTSDRERDGAKVGRLEYRVVRRGDDTTVVSVTPITGRKHQIRVQFASRGWPILGDRKYASTANWPVGIALHSQSLTIEHPTQREPMTFPCAPPVHWNAYGPLPG